VDRAKSGSWPGPSRQGSHLSPVPPGGGRRGEKTGGERSDSAFFLRAGRERRKAHPPGALGGADQSEGRPNPRPNATQPPGTVLRAWGLALR
jgi:hypothetical protein